MGLLSTTPSSISPIFLLLLLLLPLACSASVAVHDAQISVRSVSSIVYRGTQISLFESDGHANRLFHQPLSFLDTESLRVFNDGELNRTRLYLDIYLWTDEFVRLVEYKYSQRSSVELMPMTHIQLAWSKQAVHWLGGRFNQSYRLVGDWHDGDKPQMRTTFAIDCLDGRRSCQRLQRQLNSSEHSAASRILDLRYRVRGDTVRNIATPVYSWHILNTPTYREELVAMGKSSKVIVEEATIVRLVEETLQRIAQNLSITKQELLSSDLSFLNNSLTRRLFQYFHRRRVDKPFSPGHWPQLAWPTHAMALLPPTLANLFNRIYRPQQKPNRLRVSIDRNLKEEISESMSAKVGDAIKKFVESHKEVDPETVRNFVSNNLDSSLDWDAENRKFVPGSFDDKGEFYSIDKTEILNSGVVVAANLTIRRSFSEHSDPVRPAAVLRPDAASVAWQPKFADSFCVLANVIDPPRMRCHTIGYQLPERSLKTYEGIFRSVVSFEDGRVGQNSFSRVGDSSRFTFALRICCTEA